MSGAEVTQILTQAAELVLNPNQTPAQLANDEFNFLQMRELIVGLRNEVQTMNTTKFVAIDQAIQEVKQQIKQVETTAEPLFPRASD